MAESDDGDGASAQPCLTSPSTEQQTHPTEEAVIDMVGHRQPRLRGSSLLSVATREGTRTPEKYKRRGQRPGYSSVDLTCQHKNHTLLVEGPEIEIRPVGTRRVTAGSRWTSPRSSPGRRPLQAGNWSATVTVRNASTHRAPPIEDHGLRPRSLGAKRRCWPWATGNSNRLAHDPQLGTPPHPLRHVRTLVAVVGGVVVSRTFCEPVEFCRRGVSTTRPSRTVHDVAGGGRGTSDQEGSLIRKAYRRVIWVLLELSSVIRYSKREPFSGPVVSSGPTAMPSTLSSKGFDCGCLTAT
jgi:hypothetical protein